MDPHPVRALKFQELICVPAHPSTAIAVSASSRGLSIDPLDSLLRLRDLPPSLAKAKVVVARANDGTHFICIGVVEEQHSDIFNRGCRQALGDGWQRNINWRGGMDFSVDWANGCAVKLTGMASSLNQGIPEYLLTEVALRISQAAHAALARSDIYDLKRARI